jgi:hypothetical protein
MLNFSQLALVQNAKIGSRPPQIEQNFHFVQFAFGELHFWPCKLRKLSFSTSDFSIFFASLPEVHDDNGDFEI